MRRELTDRERTHLLEILKIKAGIITKIMMGFKIFGGFIICLIIYSMIFEETNKENIPFMIVGCGIIFLIFFKFTGFLAKQNQWMKLLKCVEKKQEIAYVGTLINAYRTSHGDRHGAKESMGHVQIADREIRCNIEHKLMENISGTEIVLITDTELGKGFGFAIKTIY